MLGPVAMAYGLISGVGPAAGLYGAVAIGLVAAAAGGCRALIAGPNVFVALVLAPVAAEYGLMAAFTTGMLAGVILVGFAVVRVGRLVAYIPHSLLVGFFAAAGIILVVTHILPALGLPTAAGGAIGNAAAWPRASVNLHALVVGTVIGAVWFPAAPVVGDIPRGLPNLTTPVFNPAFILPAFTMALISAANALITALQADNLVGSSHRSNRLLAALGVGNLLGGFLGGNPGGASVTTFLNIQTGGRSVLSPIVAALVVLLTLLFLPIERIPIAALAGIVIVNGWLIIDWRYLKRMVKIPRGYAAVTLTTAVVAMLVDFNVAVVIGLVVAALVGAVRSERSELQRLVSLPLPDSTIWPDGEPFESQVGLVVMPDWVSVASTREMARVLNREVAENQVTIFDFRKVAYMDDTAATLVTQVVAGRRVALAGLHGVAQELLTAFGDVSIAHVVSDVEEAKAAIREGKI